ncbi:MAG TPA: aminopeptidase N [Candidatus Dormibacteraeota bacterium]|nr:aminopeptidase N [Candidatus Dormibacteraeota bacterium]
MPTAPATLTRAEARERAQLIESITYFIELDMTGGEERFGFEARLEFSALAAGAPTFLEAEVDSITEMVWNGTPLSASAYDGRRIALPALAERNTVLVRGEASYDQTGLGLHRSKDPVDGCTYIYADFAPYEAHRSFPCFDQPDLKGSFRFRVRVPADWVVVSTDPGQPEEVDPLDGCRWWGFPPTMPLAPYVIGLAAGPFHRVESQRGATPLALYCARSLAQYLDAEELFQITAQGIDYYERVFRIPFPFSKYDQVFCPEKADGAMESPGCVTITDEILFRGQVTAQQRSYRADLIMHELAHMWFGNLVTMRWWDDLWLNESFATLMAVFAVDRATEFPDAWVAFATVNKQLASNHDQLRTSHPVVTEVPDVEAVRANFDTITYEKGAAVLRQLLAYVGEENFFDALHTHLVGHQEANADFGDLLEALQSASGRDVRGWAKAWLETVGMNLLRCDFDSEPPEAGGVITRATVVQSASPNQPRLRPHRIRLGRFDWVGDKLERVGAVELDIEGPRTEVAALVGTRRPALLLPNDGDLSYVKIRLDPLSMITAEEHLSAVTDPLARALIWDRSWDRVRDLEVPANRYARMVAAHITAEDDTTLVGVVLGNFREATRRYGAPQDGWELEAEMAEAAWDVLARCSAEPDQQAVWLQGFISLATTAEQVGRCRAMLAGRDLPEGVPLDAELRWNLVRSLAARGAAGRREIDAAREADPSSTGMVRAAGARAARPTAAAKKQAWARLAAPDVTVAEARGIARQLGGVRHEELLLPYLTRLPQLFAKLLTERGGEFTVQVGAWISLSLAPSQELARSCEKNLERSELDPILRRIFADFLEDTERYLRARLLDEDDSKSN